MGLQNDYKGLPVRVVPFLRALHFTIQYIIHHLSVCIVNLFIIEPNIYVRNSVAAVAKCCRNGLFRLTRLIGL